MVYFVDLEFYLRYVFFLHGVLFCKILGFCGIQDMSYDLDYDIFYSIVEGYKCCGDSFCLLFASYSGFKARYLRNVDIRLLDYKVMS